MVVNEDYANPFDTRIAYCGLAAQQQDGTGRLRARHHSSICWAAGPAAKCGGTALRSRLLHVRRRLQTEQLCVQAPQIHQHSVAALFHDSPCLEHVDAVGREHA
jgi:hypothetical protein